MPMGNRRLADALSLHKEWIEECLKLKAIDLFDIFLQVFVFVNYYIYIYIYLFYIHIYLFYLFFFFFCNFTLLFF